MKRWLAYLSLFSSTSTLICCALPALLVSLGLGAVLAGLVSNIPQLIWLSEHKTWLFGIAFFLILLNGWLRHYNQNQACPTEASQAAACRQTRDAAFWIYWLSVSVFGIGVTFAYILPIAMKFI